MQPYILGIDIGTGSTKAVAIDIGGNIIFASQAFYPDDANHSTQDPEHIWDAFSSCIQQVINRLHKAPEAISLSSAMHSIMCVAKDGRPLSLLVTWADDRAAGIALDLIQQPLGKELYEQCGTPIHALSPLCKIAWWQQNEPNLFGETFKFIGIKEWIWHRLFGVFEIDHSLASATGMFHLSTANWYEPALQFAGIGHKSLSSPVPTLHQRNQLLTDVAAALNLSPKTKFIIGASDGCLANLGTNALGPGVAAMTIGTSGAVRMAVHKPRPQFPEQLFNYKLDENLWITGGAINNGGAAVNWIADLLFLQGLDTKALESIEKIPAGADGLLFLPFLLGERAPIWDSHSSAAFLGLRQHHHKGHMLKAVIESVCFALRSVMEPLENANGKIGKLHLSGGFTRSTTALQILADCMGKEVVRMQTEDASAIGAAYLGFKALGWINDYDAIKPSPAVAHYLPDPHKHERYNEIFTVYKGLYPALKDTMHQLRNIAAMPQ